MTERNATDSTTQPRERLKTAASARWKDERSAEMWAQYADEITQYDDRQAWDGIIRDVVGEEPKRVLDVGTGAGFLAGLYAGVGHDVVGCDFSGSMLDQARERAARDKVVAEITGWLGRADETTVSDTTDETECPVTDR